MNHLCYRASLRPTATHETVLRMNLRTLLFPALTIAIAAGVFIALNFIGQQQGPDEVPLQVAEVETTPTAEEEAAPGAEPEGQEPEQEARPEAEETEVTAPEAEQEPEVETASAEETEAAAEENPSEEDTPAEEAVAVAPEPEQTPVTDVVEEAPVAPTTPEAPEVAEITPAEEEPAASEEEVVAVLIEDEASGTTEVVVAEEENGNAAPGATTPEETVAIVDETPEPTVEAVEEEPLGLIIELSELSELEQARFGRTTIENSGNISIIRGQGVPGTRLELLVNDIQAAETFVDPNGNWSLYESGLLGEGLQVLSLRTSLADGRIGLSDDTVSVVIDPASASSEAQMAVLGDADGVRSFLSGPRFVREIVPQMLIAEGDTMRLVGKAPAGSEVRLSLGGQEAATGGLIGADGVWDISLDQAMGQTATLIQWNPVTRTEEARQTLTLPDQAALDAALNIGQQQVVFF